MDKIKAIFKKLFSREVIMYVIFGVLTTVVNIASFKLLNSVFGLEENLSNNLAIIIAVLTAYFTNRKFVFNSTATGVKERLIEFIKFIGSRAVTMLVESGGFYLLFNIFGLNKDVSKVVITVVVIVLNYFFSKFFTFRKKKEK